MPLLVEALPEPFLLCGYYPSRNGVPKGCLLVRIPQTKTRDRNWAEYTVPEETVWVPPPRNLSEGEYVQEGILKLGNVEPLSTLSHKGDPYFGSFVRVFFANPTVAGSRSTAVVPRTAIVTSRGVPHPSWGAHTSPHALYLAGKLQPARTGREEGKPDFHFVSQNGPEVLESVSPEWLIRDPRAGAELDSYFLAVPRVSKRCVTYFQSLPQYTARWYVFPDPRNTGLSFRVGSEYLVDKYGKPHRATPVELRDQDKYLQPEDAWPPESCRV